jgi:hypothetical protein
LRFFHGAEPQPPATVRPDVCASIRFSIDTPDERNIAVTFAR